MEIKSINGLSKKVKKFTGKEARDLEKALQNLKYKDQKWLVFTGEAKKLSGTVDSFVYRVNMHIRIIYKLEGQDIVILDIVDIRKKNGLTIKK